MSIISPGEQGSWISVRQYATAAGPRGALCQEDGHMRDSPGLLRNSADAGVLCDVNLRSFLSGADSWENAGISPGSQSQSDGQPAEHSRRQQQCHF